MSAAGWPAARRSWSSATGFTGPKDPRATHLRQLSGELAECTGDDTYYRMSRRMEEVVLADKSLYPNVDFFAATVYHYLGIPTDLFTRCSR
jgi:citrate synthase